MISMKLPKSSEKSLCDGVGVSGSKQESEHPQGDQQQALQEEEGVSEASCSTLPEHLVERILAMMPFPHIFKARVLSKSWLSRFSTNSSQGDKEKERLAFSFQQEVGKWSSGWDLTSCSLAVSEQDLIAYNQLAAVCSEIFDPDVEGVEGNAIFSLDWCTTKVL